MSEEKLKFICELNYCSDSEDRQWPKCEEKHERPAICPRRNVLPKWVVDVAGNIAALKAEIAALKEELNASEAQCDRLRNYHHDENYHREQAEAERDRLKEEVEDEGDRADRFERTCRRLRAALEEKAIPALHLISEGCEAPADNVATEALVELQRLGLYDPRALSGEGEGKASFGEAYAKNEYRRAVRRGEYDDGGEGEKIKRTSEPRVCHEQDEMGNGCSESTWHGGQWGVPKCHNPAHHEPCEDGEGEMPMTRYCLMCESADMGENNESVECGHYKVKLTVPVDETAHCCNYEPREAEDIKCLHCEDTGAAVGHDGEVEDCKCSEAEERE
jgi:hypothetical protein